MLCAVVKRVTDHILDHGYSLVDIDGNPTTWGYWSPEKLNDDPVWWQERGLNSLEMLSHLKVAYHIVADPRYTAHYRELVQKHHYAINTLEAKVPGGVSHDDQLLFLSYYPLLQLEREAGLRAIFTSSLKRTWEAERVEKNPLWSFIYGGLDWRIVRCGERRRFATRDPARFHTMANPQFAPRRFEIQC